VISGLSIKPRSFTLRRASKTPAATIAYTDSQAATATLTVMRLTTGIRAGNRTRIVNHDHVKGSKCKLAVKVGSFVHQDIAGRNRIAFTGKVGTHTLRPGSYELTVRAGGGNVALARFKIVA
jgi:hypothetical protein